MLALEVDYLTVSSGAYAVVGEMCKIDDVIPAKGCQ
jgi:hypothetical protein